MANYSRSMINSRKETKVSPGPQPVAEFKVWHIDRGEYITIHELLPHDEEYFGIEKQNGEDVAIARTSVRLEFPNPIVQP